jgi:hypothetical protein
MKKASYLLLGIVIVIAIILVFAPRVSGKSSNPCAVCHGGKGYYQYLDVLEGNSTNQIPTTINVGETKTVSVAIENTVNTPQYTTLSSATVTLSSQNGHFSVSAPSFNVGNLPKGTKTATWQITGVSSGTDSLLITANANNAHQHLSFSDSYSPNPSINVAQSGPPPPPPPPPPPTTYIVTLQSSSNGTTSPTSGSYNHTSGSSVTFTGTPKTGYKFDYWIVNGVTNANNPMTLTITSDTAVIPVLTLQAEPPPPAPASFTVTLESSVNGTTTPAAGNYSHAGGDTMNLTATPNANYRFEHWLVNGAANTANPLTLTVTSDVTAVPIFSLVTSPIMDSTSTPTTDQSSTPTSMSKITISISSPAEGEKWQVGTTHTIEWTVSESANSLNVTLEYSTVGYDGPWTVIGTNIPFSGSLVWTMPSTPATYYIRAIATDSANPSQGVLAMTSVEIIEPAPLKLSPEFLIRAIGLPATLVPGVLVPVARVSIARHKRKANPDDSIKNSTDSPARKESFSYKNINSTPR